MTRSSVLVESSVTIRAMYVEHYMVWRQKRNKPSIAICSCRETVAALWFAFKTMDPTFCTDSYLTGQLIVDCTTGPVSTQRWMRWNVWCETNTVLVWLWDRIRLTVPCACLSPGQGAKVQPAMRLQFGRSADFGATGMHFSHHYSQVHSGPKLQRLAGLQQSVV